MSGMRAGLLDLGLLVHRVMIGIFMAVHGWAKIQNFEAYSEKFLDPFGIGPAASLGLAIFAEFGCSILVALGLGTRLACVPLAITMIVAGFIAHGADPWNKKELAFMYLIAYVVLFLTGPGRFSLDHKLFGPKAAPEPGAPSAGDPTSTVIRGPVR